MIPVRCERKGGRRETIFSGHDLQRLRGVMYFYKDKFSDYVLRVQYRFVGDQTPGGPEWAFRNSGIMLHSQSPESMTRDQSFPVSIEAQLLGGNGKDERPTGNVCTPGTNIVMDDELVTRHCTSSRSKTYHGDQWVTMEVEVHGNAIIKHVVNGQVVLEYERPQLDEKDQDAQKLIVDGERMLHEGYIALQAESHPVEFRKVEILPLIAGEQVPKPMPPVAKKVPKRLEKHGHSAMIEIAACNSIKVHALLPDMCMSPHYLPVHQVSKIMRL